MFGAIAVAIVSIAAALSPSSVDLAPQTAAGAHGVPRAHAAGSASARPFPLDRVSIIRRLFSKPVKPFRIAPRPATVPAPARYRTIRRIDFPTPGTTVENNYPNGLVTDLNNLGQITYYAAYSEQSVVPAYVINDDGSYRQLSTSIFAPFLSCPNLYASVRPTALNDVGGVAGFFAYSVSCGKPIVFSSNLGWQLQGNEYKISYFDGYVDGAQAVALNNLGVAAGYSQNDPKYPAVQALTFSATQHRHLLLDLYRPPCKNVLPGSLMSEALGINDAGQITGWEAVSCAGFDIGTYKAVQFSTHGYAKQLFPPSSNDFVSAGEAINRAGDIIGYSGYNSLGGFKAFLYRSACACITYVPNPGGGQPADIEALGINASDEIVGFVDEPSTNASSAFIYKNGVSYDLNSLLPANSGWTLFTASSINDAGEIIGEGQYLDPSTKMLEVGVYAMKP